MSLKRKIDDELNKQKSNKKLFKKNSEEIVTVLATSEPQTVYLNEEKTSWIKIQKLDPPNGLTMEEFEELWKLKPEKKLQIKIGGRIISCPRYSQSYLKAYKFSGLNHEANLNLPERIEKLLEYSKKSEPNLNQSLINWYDYDGSIGSHSDDIRPLIKDSNIYSYSFGPAKRTFILESKKNKIQTQGESKKYHVKVEHNALVIMGGKCQETHHHSVPKAKLGLFSSKVNERRLNVTFRCFK